MKKKNIILITYDYPCKCTSKEYIFIKNDLNFLSQNFEKIFITPIKYPKKNLIEKNNFNNVFYDFDLSKEIYNPINILISFFLTIVDQKFYKEILSLKFLNLKKIKMIFFETLLSNISSKWMLKKQNNFEDNIYYSFWSNFVLLAFGKIKKKKSNFKCFSRSLGSDINGYIPNDSFVPFLKTKFKALNYLFILNEGQKKKLITNDLILENLIQKNYLGIKEQTFYELIRVKNKIIFLSCGNLIPIKNNLKMINFIDFFSKTHSKLKIVFKIIGKGNQKKNILNYKINKNSQFKLEFIDEVESLVDYLKKNRVDFFINFSSKEGLSYALMEAISCGIPPIVTSIPGNLEVVNNSNGYIIKEDEENFKELSDAIYNDYKNYEVYSNKKKCNFDIPKNILNQKKLGKEFIEKIKNL